MNASLPSVKFSPFPNRKSKTLLPPPSPAASLPPVLQSLLALGPAFDPAPTFLEAFPFITFLPVVTHSAVLPRFTILCPIASNIVSNCPLISHY
jgi:hypothetical protein